MVGSGCDLRDFDNFVIVSSPIANSLDLGTPQLFGRICLFSPSACRTHFPGGERNCVGGCRGVVVVGMQASERFRGEMITALVEVLL